MKKSAFLITFLACLFSSNAQTKAPGDTIGIWSEIDFDNSVNFIHNDTSAQNIWQIGRPQKTIFDSAYSAPNVMITDTVNHYPANNHSFFDLYVGSFNNAMYPYDLFFDFWHKYDTDSLKDGGYITVSWDKGQTWANIIHDDTNYIYYFSPGVNGFVPTPNLYNDSNILFNGETGFSGNSNGWIHTTLAWYALPVKTIIPSDTMIVRFNFISDNIDTQKEGWLIDHIRIFSIDLGGNVNDLFNSDDLTKISPNPFMDETLISFENSFQTAEMKVYDLQGKLIKQQKEISNNRIHLSSSGLESGVYFLRILLDGKKVVAKKVIVNR
jgi:hypothetical protein